MHLKGCLTKLREARPLVHAITNYVTANDCANITIALGGSPAMIDSKEEVTEFVRLANALYVNIGTLREEQKESIYLAMDKASELEIPIVLDPVGAAALKSRLMMVKDLLSRFKVACLKGNIAEIKCIAERDAKASGVDSLERGEGVELVTAELSNYYKTVVVATGPKDYLSKGEKTYLVNNGSPLLGRITGSGCMLGIITGAFLGSVDNDLKACLAATVTYGVVGELAEKSVRQSSDLGSFRMKIFDHTASLTEEILCDAEDYYEYK